VFQDLLSRVKNVTLKMTAKHWKNVSRSVVFSNQSLGAKVTQKKIFINSSYEEVTANKG
jgi:hypothetical protein